jgi:hypothetical protein
VRRDHYLVDRARSQVFVVGQIVEGCRGTDITNDPTCALALVSDQRFTDALLLLVSFTGFR